MVKKEARILVYGCAGNSCCGIVLRGVFSIEAVFLSLKGLKGLVEEITRSSVFHELEYVAGETLGLPLKKIVSSQVSRDSWILLEAYRGFARLLAGRVLELAHEDHVDPH